MLNPEDGRHEEGVRGTNELDSWDRFDLADLVLQQRGTDQLDKIGMMFRWDDDSNLTRELTVQEVFSKKGNPYRRYELKAYTDFINSQYVSYVFDSSSGITIKSDMRGKTIKNDTDSHVHNSELLGLLLYAVSVQGTPYEKASAMRAQFEEITLGGLKRSDRRWFKRLARNLT